MRRTVLLLASMVLAVLLLTCTGVVLAQNAEKPSSPSAARAAQKAPVIPDRYIVVFNDKAFQGAERTSSVAAAERTSARAAGELARKNGLQITHTYGSALKGFAAKIPPGRLDAVRNNPRVAYVVKDREIRASSQSLPTGIDRADADLSSTQAGNGGGSVRVDVAVIDSGIYTHADLNVKGGYNCMTTDRSAWQDDNGHGTHVAGTVAAKDNAAGVVGVAPGARLWAIKVLDSNGDGSVSSITCGVNRVTRMNNDSITTNNIEVANMSISGAFTTDGSADDGNCGKTNNDPMHRAICRSIAAKTTYVVAAGNDRMDTSDYAPASYDEVITVSSLADYNGLPSGGAVNSCNQDRAADDNFAYSSNFGSDVDIAAPGVCITSTWKGGTFHTDSGTSMASPHVSGAAALYKATHRAATPTTVKSFVVSAANTEALGLGHTDTFGQNPEPVLQMDNY